MKNDEGVLRVGIASREEIQARTLAIVRGEIKVTDDDPKVWLTSIESLAEISIGKERADVEIHYVRSESRCD